MAALGETTFDVYLNEEAFWRNIPSAVWDYRLGGYQVLKKWALLPGADGSRPKASRRGSSSFHRTPRGELARCCWRHPKDREQATVNEEFIDRNPDVLGGTPVFSGTRVPVRILMEHLEEGDRLDDFLDDYPTVTREQAVALLERATSTGGRDPMEVLLDEPVPRRLAVAFPEDFGTRTVQQMDWMGRSNGELRRLAAGSPDSGSLAGHGRSRWDASMSAQVSAPALPPASQTPSQSAISRRLRSDRSEVPPAGADEGEVGPPKPLSGGGREIVRLTT